MTDTAAPAENKPVIAPENEAMAWDSKARRMVVLWLPLTCFLIILLFPFYWMTVTAFKPDAELYDFNKHNPLWISSPTLDHIYHLLFNTSYPSCSGRRCWWHSRDVPLAVRERVRRLCPPAAAFQG
jgi:multiple sugar transport system permease protein